MFFSQDQVTGAVGQTSLSTSVTGDSLCTPDPCHPDPCNNGALCQVMGNTYTCDCIAGFTGTDCSEDIDECSNGSKLRIHETLIFIYYNISTFELILLLFPYSCLPQ